MDKLIINWIPASERNPDNDRSVLIMVGEYIGKGKFIDNIDDLKEEYKEPTWIIQKWEICGGGIHSQYRALEDNLLKSFTNELYWAELPNYLKDIEEKEKDKFREAFDNYYKDRYDGKYDPRCKGCSSICCTFCEVENPRLIDQYNEIIGKVKKEKEENHRRKSQKKINSI